MMDNYEGIVGNATLLSHHALHMEAGDHPGIHGDASEEGIDKDDDHMQEGEEGAHEFRSQMDVVTLYAHVDGAQLEDMQPKKKRFRGPRLWREKWQELHSWAFVRNVNGEERMFCTVCEAHGHTTTRNAFRKEGSTNFQPSALSTHANSSAHKSALLMQKAWEDASKVGAMSRGRGKGQPGGDNYLITTHLTNLVNMASNMATREDVDSLKDDLRTMMRCQDARRINESCHSTDPLIPVPTLDGSIPENFPATAEDVSRLSSTHVDELLNAYELPVMGRLDSKLRRLKAHLGVRV
ncbi:hypothetical protein O6H91_14G022100 [Diphasiastrum complanatum]|uniref:Uncharacterized protein n=1 Tax=Diphasiastrum complanatum TaxID=34168 RepID=A0ACC2BMY0_DIPCM|nr:hypothetical protein O6H91_14G022100 [Diphasiastrum complanatum]